VTATDPVVTGREISWQVCYLVSNGEHSGMQPDRTEEAARRQLARARRENRQAGTWHAHRIERVTTSEPLDW
jgi:hypothetical protein